MKEIAFTSAASRQWRKLPAGVRGLIDVKLMAFASSGTGDVKKLKGIPGLRLRVGEWRVILTTGADAITVHAVGHRREIYD